MDLDANNQQTGDIPRRRVALPFGFVSQNGRNLRVAQSIRSSHSVLRVIHASDITVAQITTNFNRLRLFGIMPSSPCLAAGKRLT